MGVILSFLVGNPMVILGLLGVFVFTSVGADLKGWYREHQIVKPWAAAVKERDDAAGIKDQIAIQAIQSRETANVEIESLRMQLDAAEAQRKAMGVADCPWSDDDLRMLNGGRPGAKGATLR